MHSGSKQFQLKNIIIENINMEKIEIIFALRKVRFYSTYSQNLVELTV